MNDLEIDEIKLSKSGNLFLGNVIDKYYPNYTLRTPRVSRTYYNKSITVRNKLPWDKSLFCPEKQVWIKKRGSKKWDKYKVVSDE